MKEVSPHHPCLHLCSPQNMDLLSLLPKRGQREGAQWGASLRFYHPSGFIGGHSLGGTASASRTSWGTGLVVPLPVCHRPARGPTTQDSRSYPPHVFQRVPTCHQQVAPTRHRLGALLTFLSSLSVFVLSALGLLHTVPRAAPAGGAP